MIFHSKQGKVESQLVEYRENVATCLAGFRQAFEEYCSSGDRQALQKNYMTMHKAESRADDIRRSIEVLMYSKSIFPESRGDIMGLLEAMDKVPNQAEYTVQAMLNQHIVIPESFQPGVLQLVNVCHRCVGALLDASAKLFEDFTEATALLGKIDELESEADTMEAALTEGIFASDMDGFDKLLLRDLCKCIGAVSDRAENAGDRIRVIVAKRRI